MSMQRAAARRWRVYVTSSKASQHKITLKKDREEDGDDEPVSAVRMLRYIEGNDKKRLCLRLVKSGNKMENHRVVQ
jgi:hypothetical protein